jgi:threonine dehydrogenase-like Zn-dependent dehydrogenase
MFVMPSVGLYGVDMAGVGVGATVVVIGLGMIGLGVVSAAVRRGAVVVGIDPRSERRTLAARFGAAATLAPEPDGTVGQVADLVPGMSDSQGADFVFESTGLPGCIDLGIRLCPLAVSSGREITETGRSPSSSWRRQVLVVASNAHGSQTAQSPLQIGSP